ncbi:tetratricopeptide repeat protein, partial [bacterium]|nr:tetratricopeptide repeat protein [bacterium]
AAGLVVMACIVAAVWLVVVPSIQKKQEPAKRPTLAVIAFSDDTGDERFQKVQIGRVINDAMVQKFYEFPAVQLISPLRIARAMKELQIDDQSIAGKKELAEKVAKETNSRLMITGSLKKFGDTFILAADLNDLDEERLLSSFILQEVKEESILGRLIDSLCMKFQMKISDEFSLKDTSKFKFLSINELTTNSLEAYSYLVRGWEMSMSGLFHPGIDEMIKAVEIDTNFALAYSLISCNASFNKEDSLSAVYGQKAFRFKDKFRGRTSKEALIFQGNLGWFENDVEECERNYRLITELYPDDREGYYYYGSYLAYLKKDYKKALEVYEKARALTPDYFPVIRDIAYITKELRGADEGVKIIQEFIRNHPHDQSLDYARKMIAQFRGVM